MKQQQDNEQLTSKAAAASLMTITSETKRPKYTNHNGYLMPFGFPAQNFTSSLSYEPDPNDLFICTYPKCGTTLTQHMVYLLLNDGVPVQSNEKLDQLFPHLEEVGSEYVRKHAVQKSNYKLIKTHLPYNRVKNNPKAKYIFVARNPKDCVVSFFHHTRGFPKHYDFEDGSFDLFFDLFCEGRVDFGFYFDMMRSWFDRRHEPNVLFLTYEYIISNKEEAIMDIAKFLSDSIVKKLSKDNGDFMKRILIHSSVESMKKDPLRWCSEREAKFTPFIRKGKMGVWDELLQDEHVETLDKMTREFFDENERKELGEKY